MKGKKQAQESKHIGVEETFRFNRKWFNITTRIVIDVKDKRRALNKCVGDEAASANCLPS